MSASRSSLRRWLGRGERVAVPNAQLERMHRTARQRPAALPRWLRRRLDPASIWWRDDDASIGTNLSDRTWTRLGLTGAAAGGLVDPTGSIWPGASWPSVDWWIGVGGQWKAPAGEPSVRQRLEQSSPIVVTSVRATGGDVIHRCWAVPGKSGHPLVVVEIENATGTQIGVALGVTPHTVVGLSTTSTVTVDPSTLTVDGRPLLTMSRPGAAVIAGDGADHVLEELTRLTDPETRTSDDPITATSPDGFASAAIVVPLGTGATIRAVIDPNAGAAVRPADDLPDHDAVARGWEAQADRGVTWQLPPGPLADASAAARRHLLAAIGDPDLLDLATTAPGAPAEDLIAAAARRCSVLTTAGRLGWTSEVTTQVSGWDERRRRGGAQGALDSLAELAGWSVLPGLGATELATELLGHVVDALSRIDSGMDRIALPDPAMRRWWRNEGERILHDTGRSLARVGESDAANEVAGVASRWMAAETLADDGAALEQSGGAVFSRRGHSPGLHVALTAALARTELITDPDSAGDRIGWVCRSGSTTWAWPTVVDPRTATGCGGADGHDPWVSAELIGFVLDVLIDERGEVIEMVRWWPNDWDGSPLEVHRVGLGAGQLGYAVRWHGPRPAIIWELASDEGVAAPFELVAPALDPTFTASDPRGEALMTAPDRSEPVDPDAPAAVQVDLRSSRPDHSAGSPPVDPGAGPGPGPSSDGEAGTGTNSGENGPSFS